MVKSSIINVTYYTPQNRVSDTIMLVILNILNGVVEGALGGCTDC